MPVNEATSQLVAKFSRLYSQASPDDQVALRVWIRDIIRKVGSANMVHARRSEKRMVEACEPRILEFPLGMDAHEVAQEQNASLVCLGVRLRKYYCLNRHVRAKAGT
jgi:hypothetical protein